MTMTIKTTIVYGMKTQNTHLVVTTAISLDRITSISLDRMIIKYVETPNYSKGYNNNKQINGF